MPSISLDTWNVVENKIQKIPIHTGVYILVERSAYSIGIKGMFNYNYCAVVGFYYIELCAIYTVPLVLVIYILNILIVIIYLTLPNY